MEPTLKIILTPVSAAIEGGSVNIFDLIQILFSAMFNFMEQTAAAAPKDLTPEQEVQLKDEICDYINTAALNVVTMFHPEYDAGEEDIADEAVLELMDEKLAQQLADMSPEDKEKAAAFIEERKLYFSKRATQILSVDDIFQKVMNPPPEPLPGRPCLAVLEGGKE